VNVWLKLPPDIVPEFQIPLPLQQLPDVVEWKPLAQVQVTVAPIGIVVVDVPLCASRKTLPPPAPTLTPYGPDAGVGVGAGIGVEVGAGGAVVPGLGVAVGTTAGSVGAELLPHEMTAEKMAAKRAAARRRKRGDLIGHLRDRM
jgi:hypothetical protein